MQLEKMDAFFAARLDGYEAHMLKNIDSAEAFYPFTAEQLPDAPGIRILDLGCGTGLELDWYFRRNPTAGVTGIDLSAEMLAACKEKYPHKELELICGNYFTVPLGEQIFDGAVSVESLHHFTKAEKITLYRKLFRALKPGAAFVLTDYFALSAAEEALHRQNFMALKAQQGGEKDEIYHYDTPLTVAHETEALRTAGFDKIEVLAHWGATYTIKAEKGVHGK